MRLVNIDRFDAQTFQRSFARRNYFPTLERRSAAPYRRREPSVTRTGHLGRDYDRSGGFGSQPATENLLGQADLFGRRRDGINLGGIEKVDPLVVGQVANTKCFGFVALGPERHRPHANIRNVQSATSQSPSFHNLVLVKPVIVSGWTQRRMSATSA